MKATNIALLLGVVVLAGTNLYLIYKLNELRVDIKPTVDSIGTTLTDLKRLLNIR